MSHKKLKQKIKAQAELWERTQNQVSGLQIALTDAREQLRKFSAQLDGFVTPVIGEYLMQEHGTAELKIERQMGSFTGGPQVPIGPAKTSYVVQLHGKTYQNGVLTDRNTTVGKGGVYGG